MIKRLIVGIIFCSPQLVFTQTTTNAAESKYQFTKVAHLDVTPVESQGMTGTCWSFSSLSFFESELMRLGNKKPAELSEMFIARKAYESKADRYIRMDGKINFSQGGAFHDIPYVMKRYGIVPKSVYSGLVGGNTEYDHAELFAVLDGFMSGILKEALKGYGIGTEWKTAFNAILDAYMGADVKEFTVDGKKYTPQSYAASLGLKMDEYISITSFSNDPFYETCQLAIPDNWAWGESYNVPLADLSSIAESALNAGYTLAWGADVSEKGFNFRNGIAIYPEDESTIQVKGRDNRNFSDAGATKTSNAFLEPVKEKTVTQESRQKEYDAKKTTDDHGMHIVGLYKDQNGTKYFLVKNSWGTDNLPQGYLYVSEAYFNMKTINIYLHKDGLSKAIKAKLKL